MARIVPSATAPAALALALPVPANMIEFMQMYGSEDACLEAFIAGRRPGGFVCPRCAHTKGWRHANRRLIECAGCGYQASPTAGKTRRYFTGKGTMFHEMGLI
ncbi:MAG: transposase [Planctomycetes bacterium]|nr:transposase [Planctomycetota bacterium]